MNEYKQLDKVLINMNLPYNEELCSAMRAIELKLTPPTQEEVCKALSKYYNQEMHYEHTQYKNGFHNGNVFAIMYEDNNIRLTTKYFNSKLPPHLITMIGKFYEGGKQ